MMKEQSGKLVRPPAARSPLRGTVPARLRMASSPACLTVMEIIRKIKIPPQEKQKKTGRSLSLMTPEETERKKDIKGKNLTGFIPHGYIEEGMKRRRWLPFLVIAAFPLWLSPQGIRKAVWAGKFYDGRKEVLAAQLDRFLELAEEFPSSERKPLALIVPHAGYVYSGSVASHAYRLVKGLEFETVVVIGPSHHYGFRSCSIYPSGGYETPLGVAEIDSACAKELSRASGFSFIPEAHEKEHSIEVQIPFIQKSLPHAKIVPVVMGVPSEKNIFTLSESLKKVLHGKKALVIASTDLSHYLPKKKANEVDAKTISLIESLQIRTILSKLERRENILCGGGPVASVLLYGQKAGSSQVKILRYSDSSQAGGPESQVVGYLAAALVKNDSSSSFSLSGEEKEDLLSLARLSISRCIQGNTTVPYNPKSSHLLTNKGVFVTLKKNGRLRGCIGFIEPLFPLYEAVIQAACLAASKDPRFPPVEPSELKDLELEISVLSPLERIDNPESVEVGKHGLLISKDKKKGILLPQVPVENGWSRTTFLRQACLKAGLPSNAWKKGADIYVFTAVVFPHSD